MTVYTEIMMQQHFSGKNVPSKEFLLSSYVNVLILMIISIAVFKFIFCYGCNHMWNSGVCTEKYVYVFIRLLLSSLLEYHCKGMSHRWSLSHHQSGYSCYCISPGGNNLVPQQALLSHKACRYERSHLTATALWTNNVGGKFPCFRNHGGVELWLSAIKHLFINFWDFFKIVNLFQKALAPVEPSTKVPFTAAAFNVAANSMASSSALPQVSGKQNNPGGSLEFWFRFAPELQQVETPVIYRT